MDLEKEAKKILVDVYNEGAAFRDGQLEAIKATMTHKRTLVVQKTGWGKSLVYFISTKLLRNNGGGVALIVSPLLVLMENQIEAANKLNLKCDMLNSLTRDRRTDILENLVNDNLDVVFVTPETLFTDEVQDALLKTRISLFVIDEAHCISQWGHDFRLDYCNLVKVISNLPSSVSVLATTATANNRVIEDLKVQLGGDVFISRGPLSRESLSIKVMYLPSKASRYAWMLKNINNLKGTGIIYCLTKRDCECISSFLTMNGISALPFYADETKQEQMKEAIYKFERNEIKAIVATIKLGMGYDKEDIGFVIHYQCPSSIISYYQQIGRAGRNNEEAQAILMFGEEDRKINEYFINTAFPRREDCERVLNVIREKSGIRKKGIPYFVNIELKEIEKILMFLENEGAIFMDNGLYYASTKDYKYNEEHYNEIKKQKYIDLDQMRNLFYTKECYSRFVVNCLDDFSAVDCGKCTNCLKEDINENNLTKQDIERALTFLNAIHLPIIPRKRWPNNDYEDSSIISKINQQGICLCKYGDVGYGEMVKDGKYENRGFCDELLNKSVEVLKNCVKENDIKAITFVPSLNSDIVKEFGKKLAKCLNLQFVETLTKTYARPQKLMQNSNFQCSNAFDSFHIIEDVNIPDNIILVDDIVDSRWTLTVCGFKLMQNGAKKVFPFALADSSVGEM